MRVTNLMITSRFLDDLNRSTQRLDKLNNDVATGKVLHAPSDDPVRMERSMTLRSALAQNDQYLKNANDGISWLEATDSALNDLTSVLQRARELAVQGSNGTLDATQRQAIAQEVQQLLEHAVQVGNSKFDNRYLFGGTKTVDPTNAAYEPFTYNSATPSVTYNGNPLPISYEVGPGNEVAVNIADGMGTGPIIFGEYSGAQPTSDGVLPVLQKLVGDLQANDPAAVSADLGRLDKTIDNLMQARADVGARQNRLERTRDRLMELDANFKKLISDTEDADMAQTIMDLQMQQNVYRAALATGARVIPPTLVDFLR
ncbi:MAG: flagellar hook-associated protein FlgL [Firmicutes bacterium]|nr:flagellar hook-associated protein FlgL [Bacillota bacterium]